MMSKSREQAQQRSPRGAGFTLIELLVVVSIIALLVALLLPALKDARTTARAVASASNLRQILIAAGVYLQDHKQTFYEYLEGAPGNVAWRDFGQGGRKLAPTEARPLNAYSASVDLWRSPADKGLAPGGPWGPREPSFYEVFGSSYGFNVVGVPTNWAPGLQNPNHTYGCIDNQADHIREDSRFVLFGEFSMWDLAWGATVDNYVLGYFWPDGMQGAGAFHEEVFTQDPSANLGFADGHVARVKVRGKGRDNSEFRLIERSRAY